MEKWFKPVEPTMKMEVDKALSKELSFFNKRNVLHSSGAYTQILNVGINVLNYEIKNLIKSLSNSNLLKKKDWKVISSLCKNFIEKKYTRILGYCEKNTLENINEYFSQEKVNRIVAFLDLRIEVQLQSIKEIRRSKIWDICKILLSGMTGGLITLLLSNYIK